MSLALILLIPVVVISLFCAGLVWLSRNIAFQVRLYFCLALLFLIGWVTTLYYSNVDSNLTLFFNRAVYAGPIFAMLFFSLFVDTFYFTASRRFKKLNVVTILLSVITGVIAFTSLNISSITPRLQNGEIAGYNVVPGRLSLLVVAALLLLSVGLFARIMLAYKRADEDKKKPLRLIFRALAAAIIVSLFTNLFAPLLFGGSSIANAISNLAIIVFVTTVAYSVLRYSFLDIRLVVVRSLAYIVGLVVILAAVTGLSVLLFNVLGGGEVSLNGQQLLVFAVLSVAVALSFDPLRSLFVRVTSKLFFKDSYEPAVFISTFNSSLVNGIELEKLLRQASELIEQTLKATFCTIAVKETAHTPRFVIGTRQLEVLQKDERAVIDATLHSNQRVIVRQLLGHETTTNQGLAAIMAKYDVEVIARLLASGDARERGIGYIILGPKKNGEVYNKTDTDMLAIVANELVLAVQNALRFEEIKRFSGTLQQRVDEATHKLRKTNERLRVLDQTKDDFISMASHQLRTPLTAIKGYVSMTLDGDAGKLNDGQKKMLTQAFLSAQRMVYLISDLLNVSRLKTGKFIIEPVESNLAKVIGEELDQLTETVKSRGLELTYHKPEHFPTLMIDETKIRQVIMNFVDNAIYYSKPEGHIDVYLVEKPESIEFTVVDDGIGVPRHEQHHLFTKFYRAHNAKSARPDGTGLGLFMAKKVVIAQGGAIIFKSTEGKGSTFGFTFPKAALLSKQSAVINQKA